MRARACGTIGEYHDAWSVSPDGLRVARHLGAGRARVIARSRPVRSDIVLLPPG